MTKTYHNQNSTSEKRDTSKSALLRTGYSSRGRRHYLRTKTRKDISHLEIQNEENALLDSLKNPLANAKYLNTKDEFTFKDSDIARMVPKSPERHLRFKKSRPTLSVELEELALALTPQMSEESGNLKSPNHEFLNRLWAELLALEEKQLDSMFTVFQMLIDPRMRLLRNNIEIKTLLGQYTHIQAELKKLLRAVDRKKGVYEQCAALYSDKFMQYQRNLAKLLPVLLFLDALISLSWSKKHIQETLEKVSLSARLKTKLHLYLGHEQDKSIQDIIREGKVALGLTQLMSLRVNKLALIYGHMPVSAQWTEKIQSIIEESSKISAFALSLTVKPAFRLNDRNDSQGLCHILCDETLFYKLERKVESYGLEAIKCLYFLRDLSFMIEMGAFCEHSLFASSSAFVMKLKTLETMGFLLQEEEIKALQETINRPQMARILLILLKRAFDAIKEPIIHFVSIEKKIKASEKGGRVEIENRDGRRSEKKEEKKEKIAIESKALELKAAESSTPKKKAVRKKAVLREIEPPVVEIKDSMSIVKHGETRSSVYGPYPMTSTQFKAIQAIHAHNKARIVLRGLLLLVAEQKRVKMAKSCKFRNVRSETRSHVD